MRIALVHGAWADGSSWAAVIRRLQAAGHEVVAPQLPHTSLADDVAKVRHVLSLRQEPTVVAAHSYGGQVVTALGPDAPNVVGLVYVAAFGLDEGESIGALLGQGPPTPALAKFQIDDQGFAWLPEDAILQHFAPDVDPVEARVIYAVQQPLAASTLDDVMAHYKNETKRLKSQADRVGYKYEIGEGSLYTGRGVAEFMKKFLNTIRPKPA